MFREITLAIILVSAVLAYGSYCYHSGVFAKAVAEIRAYPGQHVIYKEYTGDYSQLELIRRDVQPWAQAHNIKCLATFDELFTDWTVNKQIHANSGCIIPSEIKDLNSSEYKYKFIPIKKFLVVTFPGSFKVGRSKLRGAALTYPAAADKQIVYEMIIHHEANPLWAQPVQEALYELIDPQPRDR